MSCRKTWNSLVRDSTKPSTCAFSCLTPGTSLAACLTATTTCRCWISTARKFRISRNRNTSSYPPAPLWTRCVWAFYHHSDHPLHLKHADRNEWEVQKGQKKNKKVRNHTSGYPRQCWQRIKGTKEELPTGLIKREDVKTSFGHKNFFLIHAYVLTSAKKVLLYVTKITSSTNY